MRGDDFWSRRRARVAAEQEAEAAEVAAAARQAAEEALEEKTDAEILEELDLPDPDEMQQGDDFSVFLKETIPARIRTRALRRLWTSNPVLANVDGLLDYGEDFTDSAMVIENLQTAYQVGKGMTAHVEELARQAQEATEGEAVATAEAADNSDAQPTEEATVCDATDGEGNAPLIAQAETPKSETVRPPTMALLSPMDAVEEAEATLAPHPVVLDEPEPVPAAPRRMRFTFAADTKADTGASAT
ncbi:DUF3306 domain-containing protein [Phaeobacter italicus]|jgi:hypothetical protein|uniref:DUF3306 domain-containing protein n=1 Tax=Phaeobacter italicus TaxID=481446 RepID=UPI002FDEE1AC